MDQFDEFSRKFRQLKEWCENDPIIFEDLFRTDESVRALAHDVYSLSSELEELEEFHNFGAISPKKQPNFALFREYEEEYAPVCEKLMAQDFESQKMVEAIKTLVQDKHERDKLLDATQQISSFLNGLSDSKLGDSRGKIELAEKNFKGFEVEAINALKEAELLAEKSEWNWGGTIPEIVSLIESRVFDVEQARKVHTYPMSVAVNRTIWSKGKKKDQIALIHLLNDAARAFANGATAATITLMRSILEHTIKEYYDAKGAGLDQYINSMYGLSRREKDLLHKLRIDANHILHNPSEFFDSVETNKNVDVRILEYWLLLRDLIERLG